MAISFAFSRLTFWCLMMPSQSCRPTRIVGFKLVIESWKTIENSFPR